MAVVDVRREGGEQVAQGIRSDGGHAIFIEADLSDAAQVATVIPSAMAAFGSVDVLVNNAGLYGPINKKSIVDTPPDVWDCTLRVNVTCPYLLCRQAIPGMIEGGGGSIVNIASIGGLGAFPEFAAYAVSKAALIQLTRSIALDFGRYQVRANAVCPGAIDTPGNDPFVDDREKYLQLIASLTPLGSIGQPLDVAQACLYLASDESRYITGTTLVVDGGRMAKA